MAKIKKQANKCKRSITVTFMEDEPLTYWCKVKGPHTVHIFETPTLVLEFDDLPVIEDERRAEDHRNQAFHCSGNDECSCGKKVREHAIDQRYRFVRVMCNGKRAKCP